MRVIPGGIDTLFGCSSALGIGGFFHPTSYLLTLPGIFFTYSLPIVVPNFYVTAKFILTLSVGTGAALS